MAQQPHSPAIRERKPEAARQAPLKGQGQGQGQGHEENPN